MKFSPAAAKLTLLVYSFTSVFVPTLAHSENHGTVDCGLEWHNSQQVYTYVFSGVVSRKGRPSPNARIQLQISSPSQTDLIQDTVASADGTYEMRVALTGAPSQAAAWKIVAQAPEIGAEATEIEGRSIMIDGLNQVQVNRRIQLVQG